MFGWPVGVNNFIWYSSKFPYARACEHGQKEQGIGGAVVG
jgi:hypothetical protein